MRTLTLITILLLAMIPVAFGDIEKELPIRALFVDAPRKERVDDFCKFIDEELASNHINTLILAVNYSYQFKSRPELASDNAIGKEDVQKIVEVCRKRNINVFPLINLLGHQSWSARTGKLLQVYPEFNETPNIQPKQTQWPNPEGYYCLSYCPLHPEVHDVIFPLIDEVLADFQAKDFHAGMDEVFYIGHNSCPRCKGKDPAKLFADEVQKIRDHLAQSKAKLWIWGDRLIDGKKIGVGEWEGAVNGTAPALTMIPKDIVICDWHYDRAETTAPIFAAEGIDVVSCFWNRPQVAADTIDAVRLFRKVSNNRMTAHYRGVMQTIWSGNDRLLGEYYDEKVSENTSGASLKRAFKKFDEIE